MINAPFKSLPLSHSPWLHLRACLSFALSVCDHIGSVAMLTSCSPLLGGSLPGAVFSLNVSSRHLSQRIRNSSGGTNQQGPDHGGSLAASAVKTKIIRSSRCVCSTNHPHHHYHHPPLLCLGASPGHPSPVSTLQVGCFMWFRWLFPPGLTATVNFGQHAS